MTAAPVLAPTAPVVRLLGVFEVAGAVVPTARKERATLAILALHAGTPLRTTDIARELWGQDLPSAWCQTVQTYILHLRKCEGIGSSGIATTGTGYMLTLARPDQVDALRFIRFVDQARQQHTQGHSPLAADTLRAAMSLWQGDALIDVHCGPVLSEWRRRITDRSRSARQLRFEIALASGGHYAVLDDLRSEWRRDPTSEPITALLMLALYRCQWRGEALEVFARTRGVLLGELGLDPGPALQRLQQQVLAGTQVSNWRRSDLDREPLQTAG